MNKLQNERGQTLVISVLFLVVLCGMAAAVLDVGSWVRAQRATQAAADAAALAAAQALPYDPGKATTFATNYANTNGGGLDAVSFRSQFTANDTVHVELKRPAPGFFAKVFGIDSVTVGARATAAALPIAEAKWVSPIGVDKRHPLVSGSGCPCFDTPTTLDLNKVGPGAFRLINIDGSRGGTGPSTLEDWILEGLDAYMKIGEYYSDSGAKFNSGQIKAALDARIGTELIFPVYDDVKGTGSNAQYEVVGWVGFKLTGYDMSGSNGLVFGSFTSITWEGFQASKSDDVESFGVRVVTLTE